MSMIARVSARDYKWVKLKPAGFEILHKYLAAASVTDATEVVEKYLAMDGFHAFPAEKFMEIFGGRPVSFSEIFFGGGYTLRLPMPMICQIA